MWYARSINQLNSSLRRHQMPYMAISYHADSEYWLCAVNTERYDESNKWPLYGKLAIVAVESIGNVISGLRGPPAADFQVVNLKIPITSQRLQLKPNWIFLYSCYSLLTS
jgi:hypothetical protein